MDNAMTWAKVPDTGLSPGELGLKEAGQSTFPSPRVLGTLVYTPSFGLRPHTGTT